MELLHPAFSRSESITMLGQLYQLLLLRISRRLNLCHSCFRHLASQCSPLHLHWLSRHFHTNIRSIFWQTSHTSVQLPFWVTSEFTDTRRCEWERRRLRSPKTSYFRFVRRLHQEHEQDRLLRHFENDTPRGVVITKLLIKPTHSRRREWSSGQCSRFMSGKRRVRISAGRKKRKRDNVLRAP